MLVVDFLAQFAMVVKKELEIPETWDIIKYEKPIHPTCSRGVFGKAVYDNCKNHCYGVNHLKPFYVLTPYQAPGLGYAAKNSNYIPLTHVKDRSKPKLPEFKYGAYGMKKIYDANIAAVKSIKRVKARGFEEDSRTFETSRGDVKAEAYDFKKERETKRQEASGYERYNVHVINRTLRNHRDMLDAPQRAPTTFLNWKSNTFKRTY